MPAFNRSSVVSEIAARREEAAQTLGAQLRSLTFIERARGRTKLLDDPQQMLGNRLIAAQNSLLLAGVEKRTAERLQMGNLSGRAYTEQISATGGRGTITLFYNPVLPLHLELTDPPLEASYLIWSFMAPPFMNCVAGQYDHISTAPAQLQIEERTTVEIAFVDNYGPLNCEGLFYQLDRLQTTSDPYIYTMTPVAGNPGSILFQGAGSADLSLAPPNTITLQVTTSGGISIAATGANKSLPTGNTDDLLVLLHLPGAEGGYFLARQESGTILSAAGVSLGSDGSFTDKLRNATDPALYMGLYTYDSRAALIR